MTYHKMRRFRQQLSNEETERILAQCTNGTLSLTDSDGTPYGVPLSYASDGKGHIYFHSALKGHKVECIANDSRCSFCVVQSDDIRPEEFTTYFRSVIVRGNIHVVDTDSEKLHGLQLLADKYSPGVDPTAEIARGIGHLLVLRLDIVEATGKQSIELVPRPSH